ncbi:hypothetical protein GCM10025859_46340 [Alicyclobacillus fastidiosus]|nr:hypothetical protein GCM10025859_46340 [Alicyclobacillus fastidiosus]
MKKCQLPRQRQPYIDCQTSLSQMAGRFCLVLTKVYEGADVDLRPQRLTQRWEGEGRGKYAKRRVEGISDGDGRPN